MDRCATAVLLPYQVLSSPIRRSATDGTVVEFAGGGGLSDKAMGRDAGPFFLAKGVRGLLLISIPHHQITGHHTIQKDTTADHTIPMIKYTLPYHTTPHHHHIHTTPMFTPYHTIPPHTTPYQTAPHHNIPYRTTRRHHINTTPRRTRQDGTVQDETK